MMNSFKQIKFNSKIDQSVIDQLESLWNADGNSNNHFKLISGGSINNYLSHEETISSSEKYEIIDLLLEYNNFSVMSKRIKRIENEIESLEKEINDNSSFTFIEKNSSFSLSKFNERLILIETQKDLRIILKKYQGKDEKWVESHANNILKRYMTSLIDYPDLFGKDTSFQNEKYVELKSREKLVIFFKKYMSREKIEMMEEYNLCDYFFN